MSDLVKHAFVKIASHKAPVFKEVKNGDFIAYGEGRPYPDYLVDLYNSSSKHKSIVNTKNRFVMGGGWTVAIASGDLIAKSKAQEVIKKANPKESLFEVTNKCDLDWRIFGGFAMEIIRSKSKDKVYLYHIDFGKVRVLVTGQDEQGNNIYKYCYLPKWPEGQLKYEKVKTEKGFREWNAFWDDTEADSSLYYHKPHRPLKNGEIDAYPIPEYASANGYIECDKEIQNFNLNNIKNNFWGGQIIKMANVFSTEEERNSFVTDFEEQKTGTDNTGSTFFIFTNSKEQEVTATPLSPSELDKQFDLLNKTVRLEVSIAHGINLKLLGNEIESQAFSRTEFNDLYELFYVSYVKPNQNEWDSIINYIYEVAGYSISLSLSKLSFLPDSAGSSQNKILESLNILPPLVANKVLESLSKTQIRGLVGITEVLKDESVTEFSKHKKVIDQFKSLGEVVESDRIVSFYDVELDDTGFPVKSSDQFSNQYFAEILGVELSKIETQIISAIKKNPKISVEDIGTAFDLKPKEVSDILSKLSESKIIVGEIGKDATISKKAITQINDKDLIVDIEVMYRYSEKGAPKLRGESREFCQEMMALRNAGRMYTRKEIDSVKNDQDELKSAWLYRGGFYTNPNTKETTPFCRHHWEAVVIRNK